METGNSSHRQSMKQGVTAIPSSARQSTTKPKQFHASQINLKAAMQALTNKQQTRSSNKNTTGLVQGSQTLQNFYNTGAFPQKLQVNRFKKSQVPPRE